MGFRIRLLQRQHSLQWRYLRRPVELKGPNSVGVKMGICTVAEMVFYCTKEVWTGGIGVGGTNEIRIE